MRPCGTFLLQRVRALEPIGRAFPPTVSRSLNEVLTQMVAKKTISAKDAMRATYNRLELHDMLNGIR